MRLSIADDEGGTILVASSGDTEARGSAQPVETSDLFFTHHLREPELHEVIEGSRDDVAANKAEILMTSPPGRPRWRLLTMAGLAVVAAIALRPWLPSTSPEIDTGPIAPTSSAALPPWAPAEPLQAPPASGQASASWSAATVDRPTTYVQFCHNSVSLCDQATPMRPNPG